MVDTVADALPREMARVRDEILPIYLETAKHIGPPADAGVQLTINIIRLSLDQAARAMAEGDVIAMIAALEDLRGYEG